MPESSVGTETAGQAPLTSDDAFDELDDVDFLDDVEFVLDEVEGRIAPLALAHVEQPGVC